MAVAPTAPMPWLTPSDMGFAGFKITTPLNQPDKMDELAVFLGASYFRALGRDMRSRRWRAFSGSVSRIAMRLSSTDSLRKTEGSCGR